MDYFITRESLKSGQFKEYVFLNGFFQEQADDTFNVLDIDSNSATRIGLNKLYYGVWQLSAKVGAIWLDKDKTVPIVVQPKVENLDTIQMYIELAEHADLFNKYQTVFKCWSEEKAIEGIAQPDITLLQVTVFLKELSRFCQRDLRQGFIRVRQNLTGKVKGKILIGENLRKNTLNAREDRVFCQYHVMSLDTPANRILKAALTRCYRYLGQQGGNYPVLLQWARQCNAALSDVPDSTITEADFRGIIYSGLMQKYKQPHQYARMILKRLRTDASGENNKSWTVPYALDMNRLFEGYVGVLLSRFQGFSFIPEESMHLNNERGLKISFRPDYHEPDKGIVVDAKYKSIVSYHEETNGEKNKDSIVCEGLGLIEKNAKPSNADIYQVIAYCKLLEEKNPVDYKTAALAVPVINNEIFDDWNTWCNNSPWLEPCDSGIKLYVLPCLVPTKPDIVS